jgi:hypothetical protein
MSEKNGFIWKKISAIISCSNALLVQTINLGSKSQAQPLMDLEPG